MAKRKRVKGLTKETRLELQKKMGKSFLFFCRRCFPKVFDKPWGKPHHWLAGLIENIERADEYIFETTGEKIDLDIVFSMLLLGFRNLGKSAVLQAAILWWGLYKDEYQNFQLCTETLKSLAEMMELPRRMVISPRFKAIFGNIISKDVDVDKGNLKGKSWNKWTLDLVNPFNGQELRITGRSRDQQYAGTSATLEDDEGDIVKARVDMYIFDDLDNEDIKKASGEKLNGIRSWLTQTVLPSRNSARHARIFYLGTVYSSQSIYLYLERQKSVFTIPVPALNIGKRHERVTKIFGIKKGEGAWDENPERSGAKYRKEMNAKSPEDLPDWWSQYVLEADYIGQNRFNPECVGDFKMHMIDMRYLTLYLLIDAGYTKKKKSSHTGIVLAGRDEYGNIFSLYAEKHKVTKTGLLSILSKVVKEFDLTKYDLECLGIETTMFEFDLEDSLKEFAENEGLSTKIVQLKHGNLSKELRVGALIPVSESGHLYVRKGRQKDLETEITDFDASVSDQTGIDILDAFSNIVSKQLKGTYKKAKTLQEVEEEKEKAWTGFVGKENRRFDKLGGQFDEELFMEQIMAKKKGKIGRRRRKKGVQLYAA